MKLRFYLDNTGEKRYTLKENIENQQTHEAHYKFKKFVEKLE